MSLSKISIYCKAVAYPGFVRPIFDYFHAGVARLVVWFVVEVLTIPAIFLTCGTNKVVWRRKGSHFEILRIRAS